MKPEQFLLFDVTEGRRLAELGMSRAAGTTGARLWKFKATEIHDRYPIGKLYSADDIIGEIGLANEVKSNENNYVGEWFRRMKEEGRIVEVKRITSRRTSNHGKKIPLYRKVY